MQDGDKNVGSGRMEIRQLGCRKSSSSWISSPLEGHNTADLQCCRRAMQPFVTWLMHGPRPSASRVMQVFMNFDNMIGKDFEVGLAN